MSLSYVEHPTTKTVEFRIDGKLTREDYDRVIGPMQAFIDAHGTVRVIEIVESFSGFDPAVLIPGIKFDIKNLSHISRVAIVSDIGWFSPLVRAASAITAVEMRMFEMAQLDEAREWAQA